MIAHVAEASEASGRVVLWLDPDTVGMPQTISAAVAIAKAYSADIETLVLEAPSADEVGDVPTAHVSLLGRALGPTVVTTCLTHVRRSLSERLQRDVVERAAHARVDVRHTAARGDAIDRLSEMCLARGPWNIVAVSRPPSPELSGIISSILANVSGATGVVVAGRDGKPCGADVAVVIEDTERMPSMLRAAERLLPDGGRIHVMISAETAQAYDDVEGHARLLTANGSRYVHHRGSANFGVSGCLDEALFRLKPAFVIARFGGSLLGQVRALTRLLSFAPGPMVLVR